MSQRALSKLETYRPHLHIQKLIFQQASPKRLVGLFFMSLLVTLWLADGSATAAMLFQSPQSPPPPVVAEQPAEPPPAEPAAEQPPAEQPPAAPPPAEPPPVEPPSAEQAPEEQPRVEQAPAEPPPAEQSSAEQSQAEEPPAEVAPPESSLVEEPAEEAVIPDEPPAEPVRVERARRDENRLVTEEEAGDRNLILDRVEFIDSIVVSGAYIWLCCGVIAFLLVPIFMLILYVRGRSKIVGEEEF